ncbi:MAG: hypothetical protein E4H23_09170 [Chrysiogenales bacterium]|nr:MAG: hypothetical protein E4H23_09170 [Chrysiogenales bacterium]
MIFPGIQAAQAQQKPILIPAAAGMIDKKPAVKVQTRIPSVKKTILPDLTFTPKSLVTTPAVPLGGRKHESETLLQVEVRNQGNGEARNFNVVFQLHHETTLIGTLVSKTIALLPAYDSRTISGPCGLPSRLAAGTYRLRAIVDIHPESVVEADERNNSVEIPLTIIGPDFAISNANIEVSPSSPSGGQTITARAPVRNHGTGECRPEIFVSLLDSSGRLLQESSHWSWIAAGGFSFVETTFTLPAGSGGYMVRFEADRDNRNAEPNESDNRGEKIFSVSAR